MVAVSPVNCIVRRKLLAVIVIDWDDGKVAVYVPLARVKLTSLTVVSTKYAGKYIIRW